MMKMGFKVGSGLGKAGEGRKEPVPINEVKTDKKGIGQSHKEQKKKDRFLASVVQRAKGLFLNLNSIPHIFIVRKISVAKITRDFKSNIKTKAEESRNYKYVCQAQKALYDLDSQHGIEKPTDSKHWPKGAIVSNENKTKSNENENVSDLQQLIENPFLSSHILQPRSQSLASESNPELEQEAEAEEEVDLAELLLDITTILRNRYKYCVYCGFSYNDFEDMENNCPGNTYENHD